MHDALEGAEIFPPLGPSFLCQELLVFVETVALVHKNMLDVLTHVAEQVGDPAETIGLKQRVNPASLSGISPSYFLSIFGMNAVVRIKKLVPFPATNNIAVWNERSIEICDLYDPAQVALAKSELRKSAGDAAPNAAHEALVRKPFVACNVISEYSKPHTLTGESEQQL